MKKPILTKIIIAVLAVLIAGLGFGAGFWVSRLTLQNELDDINFIIEMYRKYYYDEQEDVVGIFADSLLDAYSAYYTKEDYELIKKADAGSREGVGITYNGLKLKNVLFNSPAEKAGVRAGGTLKGVTYAGETTYFETGGQLTAKLDEIPAYTDFDLLVDYDGETASFTVKKEEYLRTYVKYTDKTGVYGFSDASGSLRFERQGDAADLPADTAYIKYAAFNGINSGLSGSVVQFETVMQMFKANGMKKIILDLRGNGGGYLYIMQNVCRYFLDVADGQRPLVTAVKDKYGNASNYYADNVKYNEFGFENIVILADIETASASEAFIGAVLDYDVENKVKVIIDAYKYAGYTFYRTYGKGIMQTTYERLGGGAIKLTTAKLFWPVSNVCIHDTGISEDLNSVFGDRIVNASEDGGYSDALSLCR